MQFCTNERLDIRLSTKKYSRSNGPHKLMWNTCGRVNTIRIDSTKRLKFHDSCYFTKRARLEVLQVEFFKSPASPYILHSRIDCIYKSEQKSTCEMEIQKRVKMIWILVLNNSTQVFECKHCCKWKSLTELCQKFWRKKCTFWHLMWKIKLQW